MLRIARRKSLSSNLGEEVDTLITNEEDVAVKLNNFISNAVINLKILKFENFDTLSKNIEHLSWKLS